MNIRRPGILAALLAVVASAAGCAGPANQGGNSDSQAAPAITRIVPESVVAGSQSSPLPLVIEGTGLDAQADTIELGGTRLPAGAVNTDGQGEAIVAYVDPGILTQPGAIQVQVQGAGGTSAPVEFGVMPAQQASAGVVQLISAGTDGSQANGDTLTDPAISATGRYVAFQSNASNLVSGPASGYSEIFLRDTCIGAPTGCTPSTLRVSVGYDGGLPNGHSRGLAVNASGRFVAFDSSASNLVPNVSQPPATSGVYVRDTCLGAPDGCAPSTIRVDKQPPPGGTAGASGPAISADGRFVAFAGSEPNLVAGEPASPPALIFVYDTCAGAASGCAPGWTVASLAADGSYPNQNSLNPQFSSDDRYVVFESWASNLVAGDTNGQPDVFVRDTCFGAPAGCAPTTTRVDVAGDGSQAMAPPNSFVLSADERPTISGDGRFIPFSSFSHLVTGDTSSYTDIFLRDTCVAAPAGCTPTTALVSVAFDGSQANLGSHQESISSDGRLIAFTSLATNLEPGYHPTLGTVANVYVRDTCIGAPAGCFPATVVVSSVREANGDPEIGDGNDEPAISADGHYVVFRSSNDPVLSQPGAPNGHTQVYLAKTGY